MEPEILINRISECIDDLGLLLDHIYKYPQRQREVYFDRIQTMKNKLLTLKGNVRQYNITATQKQYKQLYLAMNTLKNEILQGNSLSLSTKENKQINKYKEIKKTHVESVKIIGVKDQEINQLKSLLFQKQQLIKLNYQEITSLKQENQALLQNKRNLNYEHHDYQIELERTKALLLRAQSDVVQLKIRQDQKDRAFNVAIQELQILKIKLIQANERVISLEKHYEINSQKTRQAEETIRKAQREAENRHENILIKENDHFKKIKEISQLEFEVGIRNDTIKQLEQQTKHLKEDIEVLENQIEKHQNSIKIHKEQFNREKENLLFEHKRLDAQIQTGIQRENELKKMLEEGDKKYHIVINKLNSAQEYKVKLRQSEFQNQLITQKLCNLEVYLQKYQNQIKNLVKEKDKYQIKLEKDEIMARQSEVDMFKTKEKLKIKQEELQSCLQDLANYKNKIREYQKQINMRERKEKTYQTNLIQQKTRLVKLEQKQKVRNKEIQGLKVKLLRAKIQTIHQIRQTIQ